jgi:hypothetical protein
MPRTKHQRPGAPNSFGLSPMRFGKHGIASQRAKPTKVGAPSKSELLSDFGLRTSDFLRTADFGLRTSQTHIPRLCSNATTLRTSDFGLKPLTRPWWRQVLRSIPPGKPPAVQGWVFSPSVSPRHRHALLRVATGARAPGPPRIRRAGYFLTTGRSTLWPTHRLLAELALASPIPRTLLVHHVNGNPLDNRLKNLQLVTPTCHYHLHRIRHPLVRLCPNCRSPQPTLAAIKCGRGRFCSYSCSAVWNNPRRILRSRRRLRFRSVQRQPGLGNRYRRIRRGLASPCTAIRNPPRH